MGAELFFFPTAIGSEPPPAPPVNSREHWQRTQQGHAAANLTPLVAANRYGLERSLQDPEKLYIRFYGSSFIADGMGAKVAEAKEEGDAVLVHTFDLEAAAQLRDNWFVFRDRTSGAVRRRLARWTGAAAERDERAWRLRVDSQQSRRPQRCGLKGAGSRPCRAGNRIWWRRGDSTSVAFAAGWTMPSSACLRRHVDAERVIRLSAL